MANMARGMSQNGGKTLLKVIDVLLHELYQLGELAVGRIYRIITTS